MFEWIELFSSLWEKELETLSLFCQQRLMKSWEILFNKWEESTSMYIIKSWTLQVYDNDKILWTIKPWEFVWEMSLFDKSKVRTASVKAIEDSIVIILLSFSLNELSHKHPEILEKIRKVINERKIKNNN